MISIIHDYEEVCASTRVYSLAGLQKEKETPVSTE